MSPEQKCDHWQQHFIRWETSGLSQRAYCQQYNINFSTFGYWRKRLKPCSRSPATGSANKLVPVSLAKPDIATLSIAQLRLEVPVSALERVLPVVLNSLREPT